MALPYQRNLYYTCASNWLSRAIYASLFGSMEPDNPQWIHFSGICPETALPNEAP